MQKDAWKVVHEVAAKIDDAPVHSGYDIKCLVAEGPDDGLFFNKGHYTFHQTAMRERWQFGSSIHKENL